VAGKKENVAWSHPKAKDGGLSLSVAVDRATNQVWIDIGTGPNTSGITLNAAVTEDNLIRYVLVFHDEEKDTLTELFGDIFEPSPGEGAEGE